MIQEIFQQKGIPGIVRSGTGHFGQTGQIGPLSYVPSGGGYSVLVPREYVVEADIEAEIVLGEEWKKARLVNISFFDTDKPDHNKKSD